MTTNEQAYNHLMQIDALVDRIADRTATDEDRRAFDIIMPYEWEAYLVFCETRLAIVNEEIERRKALSSKKEQPR